MSSDKLVIEASGLIGTGTAERVRIEINRDELMRYVALKIRENTPNAKGEQCMQLAFGAIKAVRTTGPR
jgi:hypothetical protein